MWTVSITRKQMPSTKKFSGVFTPFRTIYEILCVYEVQKVTHNG